MAECQVLNFKSIIMISLFKKKSKVDILNKQYERLLKQSHELSTVDRTKSDAKFAEAQEVLKQIDNLSVSNQ